jgi:hypothetical protein
MLLGTWQEKFLCGTKNFDVRSIPLLRRSG